VSGDPDFHATAALVFILAMFWVMKGAPIVPHLVATRPIDALHAAH